MSNTVQSVQRAQKDSSADDHGTGKSSVAQIVLGHHFELAAGPKYEHSACSVGDEYETLTVNG